MSNTFLLSDPHLGHEGMLTFKRADGTPLRPFSSVDEMNETIIENYNKMVGPKDTIYFLGDIAINKRYLPLLHRFNGKKKLIPGNHDIFGLKSYVPYFDDIAGYKVFEKQRIICSHIPIAIESRARFRLNIHGHCHSQSLSDPFYYNVCVEQFDYYPVSYDDILKYMDHFLTPDDGRELGNIM